MIWGWIIISIEEKSMDNSISDIEISNKKRLYTTTELKGLGASYYAIRKLVDADKLVKLSSSIYETKEYNGEESDLYYAQAYVPEGVICLYVESP